MKLIVDYMPAPGVPSKRVLSLFDENGEALPNQVAVNLDQRAESVSTVTVQFCIDGDHIKLGAN